MDDRKLIGVGAAGAAIAAMRCATPVSAVLLPLFGAGAWLAAADYVLVPLLVATFGLVALGLYRRRASAAACCATTSAKEGLMS